MKTALSFVSPSFTVSKRLLDKASIFTKEIEALASALRYIKVLDSSKFVIFCDSKSALQALLSNWDHPSVLCILKFLIDLHTRHKTVVFCWLPSHMGISGNEKADATAKARYRRKFLNVYYHIFGQSPIYRSICARSMAKGMGFGCPQQAPCYKSLYWGTVIYL